MKEGVADERACRLILAAVDHDRWIGAEVLKGDILKPPRVIDLDEIVVKCTFCHIKLHTLADSTLKGESDLNGTTCVAFLGVTLKVQSMSS